MTEARPKIRLPRLAVHETNQPSEIMNHKINLLGSLCGLALLATGTAAETETTPPKQTKIQTPEYIRLQKMVLVQEERVEESRMLLVAVCRAKGIVYRPGGFGDGRSTLVEKADHFVMRLAEVECEKILLESQINAMLRLGSDDLIAYAINTDLPNNPLKPLHPKWQEAKLQLEKMKADGKGEGHPALEEQQRMVNDLCRRLEESVVALRFTLQTKYEIVHEQAKRLREEMMNAREAAVMRGLDLMDGDEAWRAYEAELARLDRLKDKLANEVSTE